MRSYVGISKSMRSVVPRNHPCSVCAKVGCAPIEHADEVLSDENAKRFAQAVIDEAALCDQRCVMLARYILSLSPLGREKPGYRALLDAHSE